jgi:hypothetical protein
LAVSAVSAFARVSCALSVFAISSVSAHSAKKLHGVFSLKRADGHIYITASAAVSSTAPYTSIASVRAWEAPAIRQLPHFRRFRPFRQKLANRF